MLCWAYYSTVSMRCTEIPITLYLNGIHPYLCSSPFPEVVLGKSPLFSLLPDHRAWVRAKGVDFVVGKGGDKADRISKRPTNMKIDIPQSYLLGAAIIALNGGRSISRLCNVESVSMYHVLYAG